MTAIVRPMEIDQVSTWVAPPALNATLWHSGLLVAQLSNAFPHQGTWFADFDLRIRSRGDAHATRILEYIAFCQDFNCRIANGDDHDFTEFDEFVDVSDCSRWHASLSGGLSIPMEGQLGFIDEQVSWQHPDTRPSTEMAANEYWAWVAANTNSKSAMESEGEPDDAREPPS
ncbi:hypothetical protein Mal15_48120 [Stieleria maiorica]|uniref:Uncharacterized protein n=1 Tax=Stieleria maiorica TaxID=2795974 RepID=A0A5B9MJY1_9BACT|nr:hypothetical protein Mal15_48120 [Stieleria maiorica]